MKDDYRVGAPQCSLSLIVTQFAILCSDVTSQPVARFLIKTPFIKNLLEKNLKD